MSVCFAYAYTRGVVFVVGCIFWGYREWGKGNPGWMGLRGTFECLRGTNGLYGGCMVLDWG